MRAYAREEIKVEHLPPFCLLTYLIELQILLLTAGELQIAFPLRPATVGSPERSVPAPSDPIFMHPYIERV